MKIKMLPYGKDENYEPMIELDGEAYTLLELMTVILELEIIKPVKEVVPS